MLTRQTFSNNGLPRRKKLLVSTRRPRNAGSTACDQYTRNNHVCLARLPAILSLSQLL